MAVAVHLGGAFRFELISQHEVVIWIIRLDAHDLFVLRNCQGAVSLLCQCIRENTMARGAPRLRLDGLSELADRPVQVPFSEEDLSLLPTSTRWSATPGNASAVISLGKHIS